MSIDPDKLHIIRSKPKHDSHADAIRHFEGDYECLANTYKCVVSLRGDPEPYPSVEHALQASKTEDLELKASIRQAKNAIEAKKLARVIKPTPEWRARSEKIAEGLIRDKFRRNAKAREVLLGTGRVRLVYTNSHDDRVWGVCGGKGDNKLGKLLELVRADALAGKDTDLWCSSRFDLALPLDVAINLAVVKEGKAVAELSFEGKPVVRMGKLTDNEVVMAHPSVSRSHALLVMDKTLGSFLVDLGASNGSFVDGRRLMPYVPEPVKAEGESLTFAKSKRTYTLTRVETDLRESAKRKLFESMSNPTVTAAQPDADSTIYVGNLEPSVTEQDLREFFAECGDIASIRIPQDKETGKMRGIAFVAFAKHAGVLHALTLHMDDLKGQSVKVRRADSKPDTSGAGKAPRAGEARKTGPGSREGVPAGVAKGGADRSAAAASENDSALEVARAAIIRATAAARANAQRKMGTNSTMNGASESKRTGGKYDSSRGDSGTRHRKRGDRWGDSRQEAHGDVTAESSRDGPVRNWRGDADNSRSERSRRTADDYIGTERDRHTERLFSSPENGRGRDAVADPGDRAEGRSGRNRPNCGGNGGRKSTRSPSPRAHEERDRRQAENGSGSYADGRRGRSRRDDDGRRSHGDRYSDRGDRREGDSRDRGLRHRGPREDSPDDRGRKRGRDDSRGRGRGMSDHGRRNTRGSKRSASRSSSHSRRRR